MRKEHSITNKLILSFLILSVISIILIFVVYVLYSRGEGKEYSMLTYFLVSLVFYKSYIPYITSLSVYFSFFKGKYTNQENISKVIANPIAAIILLVAFYTIYDYYAVNSLISSIKTHNANRDAMIYYEYELKLRDEAYEKAKEELASGNLDNAHNLAEEALFYDKNDGNVILLLKSIQEEKRKRYENTHQAEINNINNLIKLGTREFTLNNYNEALKYFNRVLALDNNNPLALYYLNKISIARNEKPKYYGNTTEEISVYGRLSEAISLYENGRLWAAYDIIYKLYMEAPEVAEVNNYYSIIRDAISRYDFFIREAQEVKEAYIDKTDLSPTSSIANHNGLNIMLDKNTLLSSSSGAMFKGSLYMFDVSIIKLDDELKKVSSEDYLYGKLADSLKSTNNGKNIILKAHFDTNKNDYVYSDTQIRVIPISISYSTLDIIRNYTSLNLDYVSVPDLFTLRNEMPRFGYSNREIDLELFSKNIKPISYLLLFIIIAYYSFRYRLSMASEKMTLYNRVVGVVGTLILTIVYKVFIEYIAAILVVLSNITVGVIITVLAAAVLILLIIFQMARIPRDVR
ncbi:hypothetical protein [uncultured Brachyspira sp.]|uniref:tetratricopeptide repeat protein n=1 Tax=uncultured Brachyspira sp. TaxID=221953 RepID=UPI0026057B0B|nr:hypothetical protein [uncultured Brachyspira sp.]